MYQPRGHVKQDVQSDLLPRFVRVSLLHCNGGLDQTSSIPVC